MSPKNSANPTPQSMVQYLPKGDEMGRTWRRCKYETKSIHHFKDLSKLNTCCRIHMPFPTLKAKVCLTKTIMFLSYVITSPYVQCLSLLGRFWRNARNAPRWRICLIQNRWGLRKTGTSEFWTYRSQQLAKTSTRCKPQPPFNTGNTRDHRNDT